MKSIVIGISGKKQSGKDRALETIDQVMKGVVRIKFADALKREVADMFGTTPRKLDELRLAYPEVRRLLIEVGQRRRNGDSDYWIKQVEEDDYYRAMLSNGNCICIFTDVRFPNEAAWIKRQEGYLWRVERPGLAQDTNSLDLSETALDTYTGWDSVLQNNSTPADYDKLVLATFFRTYAHFYGLPLCGS